MNAIGSFDTVRTEDARASLSCARTLKRLSWEYRRWALEAEAKGDLARYRQWAAKARQLWRSAKWHLELARRSSCPR